MSTLPVAVIAVGVLYLAIWPHELGHSAVAYFWSCKANWWETDMSWFLWGSWGGAIDDNCLRDRGGLALGLTAGAGTVVNLMLFGIALIVVRWRGLGLPRSPWAFVTTFVWALANYAEAFSYLVLNTMWLKSDMATVVVASGMNRWLWLSVGVLGAIGCGRLVLVPARRAADALETPRIHRKAWLLVFALYVALVSLAMGAARISLT